MSRLRAIFTGWPAMHVYMALGVVAVVFPVGLWAGFKLFTYPPVQVIDTYEEDAVAVVGGELDIMVTRQDNAPCMTVVARWLWRPDPANPGYKQWREIPSTPHSPPGPIRVVAGNDRPVAVLGTVIKYRISVPLPPGLEAGEWQYMPQAMNMCTGLFTPGPLYSRGFPISIAEPRT